MNDDIRLDHWMPGETPVQRTLREARKAFRRRDLQPVESKGGYWRVELKAAHQPRSRELPSFPILAKPPMSPDLERLEERVREAFPACQHPPIIIPQREPIPPEALLP